MKNSLNMINEGETISSVIFSHTFQVVIPQTVRDNIRLSPGQKMQAFEYDGRVEFIPERNIKDMRGFVKGINTTIEKERDRL